MSDTKSIPDHTRRAVILTAIQPEYLAVRQHLRDLDENLHPRGTVYDWGYFDGNAKCTWRVFLLEIGAGNDNAALEAERAIAYVDPKVVLFVGVAGGLKDTALGDVVAATDVYNYESGKDTKLGFLPRPNGSASTYNMVQRARAEARREGWKARCIGEHCRKARVFVEPLVAGEKVIATRRSDLYRLLTHNYSNAFAVEMEGHGFLKATAANPQVSSLVVRGISNLLEKKTIADGKKWQEKAAANAAAFALECLAHFDIAPEQLSPSIESIKEPTSLSIGRRVLAISGNPKSQRSEDVVFEIARLLSITPFHVMHGPRGAGIMTVNIVHNKFQRRDLTSEVKYVERERILAPAEFVVVIEGGPMTDVEASLAIDMQKKVLPIPGTGGAAEKCYQRMRLNPRSYDFWLDAELFDALAHTSSAIEDAALIEQSIFLQD